MLQEYVNHEAGLSQEEGEKIYPMLKQMMGNKRLTARALKKMGNM